MNDLKAMLEFVLTEGTLLALLFFGIAFAVALLQQGLGNRLILEEEPYAKFMGAIQCRQRLGGMLNYYYPQAA